MASNRCSPSVDWQTMGLVASWKASSSCGLTRLSLLTALGAQMDGCENQLVACIYFITHLPLRLVDLLSRVVLEILMRGWQNLHLFSTYLSTALMCRIELPHEHKKRLHIVACLRKIKTARVKVPLKFTTQNHNLLTPIGQNTSSLKISQKPHPHLMSYQWNTRSWSHFGRSSAQLPGLERLLSGFKNSK